MTMTHERKLQINHPKAPWAFGEKKDEILAWALGWPWGLKNLLMLVCTCFPLIFSSAS